VGNTGTDNPGLEFQFETERKRRFATILVALIVPLLIYYTIRHFIHGELLESAVNGAAALCLTAALLFRRTIFVRYRDTIYLLIAAVMWAFMIYLTINNEGDDSSRAFWLLIYPAVSIHLLGVRRSLPWVVSLFLLAGVYMYTSHPLLSEFPISGEGKIRFLLAYAVISVVSYGSSLMRVRFSNELVSQNTNLQSEKAKLARAMHLAESANEAKSGFLSNMSHELRTPLNHIIGFTELVADERPGPLNKKQKEYLHDVLGSSGHLLSLINDVLDLSKVESGEMECVLGSVNVRDVVAQSAKVLDSEAHLKGIVFTTSFVDVPATIIADERRLRQILLNLFSNAVKFSNDGGSVKVVCGLQKDAGEGRRSVFVSVQDFGAGIAAADQRRVFDPFVQIESGNSGKHQGTGLGLSLTRRLVDLHDGDISVESAGLGKGSTFTVTFPVSGPAV
jgi:signal transduction histidine kinase